MKYLDFENEEKGYEKFHINRQSVKLNKGRQVCFVLGRSIDPHRGYFTVNYATLDSTHYSRLLVDGGHDSVDMRDIVEAGIKIKNIEE